MSSSKKSNINSKSIGLNIFSCNSFHSGMNEKSKFHPFITKAFVYLFFYCLLDQHSLSPSDQIHCVNLWQWAFNTLTLHKLDNDSFPWLLKGKPLDSLLKSSKLPDTVTETRKGKRRRVGSLI